MTSIYPGRLLTSVCRARSWRRLASSACSPAASSSPRWGRPRPRCSPRGTSIWYFVTNVRSYDSTHHIRCKLGKCWNQTLSLLCPKSILYLSGNRQSFGLKVRSFGKFSEFILAMNTISSAEFQVRWSPGKRRRASLSGPSPPGTWSPSSGSAASAGRTARGTSCPPPGPANNQSEGSFVVTWPGLLQPELTWWQLAVLMLLSRSRCIAHVLEAIFNVSFTCHNLATLCHTLKFSQYIISCFTSYLGKLSLVS